MLKNTLLLAAVVLAAHAVDLQPALASEDAGLEGLIPAASDPSVRSWWELLWPKDEEDRLAQGTIFDSSGSDEIDHMDHAGVSLSAEGAKKYGYSKYNGPDTWSLDNPACGGTRQSPVDLSVKRMKRASHGVPLQWDSSFWQEPCKMQVTNTGHNVQVTANWYPLPTPQLRGGPLSGSYTFAQLHFHWGSQNSRGSEHTVNNKTFPMEVHAVHYKTSYGSAENAMTHPDGLAVVGFLFQMSSRSGATLSPLVKALPNIRSPHSSVTIPPVALSSLLAPPRTYAAYRGSLTTPPCSEIVTWVVAGSGLPISARQMEAFRSISSDDGHMGDNFRPVQALNGRTLFFVA